MTPQASNRSAGRDQACRSADEAAYGTVWPPAPRASRPLAPHADPATGVISLMAHRAGGVVRQLLQLAETSSAEVLDLAVGQPSLERVFLNLTGRSLRE